MQLEKMQQLFIFAVLFCVATVEGSYESDEEKKHLVEKKLSEKIVNIMEHFKQEDPVGIPEVPISDPLDIPPLKKSIPMSTIHFKEIKLYGLSKFRIKKIKSDLSAMEVNTELQIDILHANGSYTISNLFSRSSGPFTVRLSNVHVRGPARLDVDRTGHLYADQLNMDITFEGIALNFENLGFAASLLQGIINSLGTFVFDSIKPFILSEINNNVRGQINEQVGNLTVTFPNSVSPFDMMIADARKRVKDMGNDPFHLDDYNHTAGLVGLHMTNTWISGLASFYRVGNITVELTNQTAYLKAKVGTQRLNGQSNWEVFLGSGIMSRAGSLKFSVEYIKVDAAFNQSLDLSKHPHVEDLQLEVGNIQVHCNGAGTLDYLIEMLINIAPNILRYQIMDAIEKPIKSIIQEHLNGVNFERMIHDKLDDIDRMEEEGFSAENMLTVFNMN